MPVGTVDEEQPQYSLHPIQLCPFVVDSLRVADSGSTVLVVLLPTQEVELKQKYDIFSLLRIVVLLLVWGLITVRRMVLLVLLLVQKFVQYRLYAVFRTEDELVRSNKKREHATKASRDVRHKELLNEGALLLRNLRA